MLFILLCMYLSILWLPNELIITKVDKLMKVCQKPCKPTPFPKRVMSWSGVSAFCTIIYPPGCGDCWGHRPVVETPLTGTTRQWHGRLVLWVPHLHLCFKPIHEHNYFIHSADSFWSDFYCLEAWVQTHSLHSMTIKAKCIWKPVCAARE